MIFGRPTLMWDDAPEPEEYYKSFGFSEIHSLDISPYQGCTFVHDLNNADIPDEFVGKYRVVTTGGTIEHVFNIFGALQTGVKLLEIGGVFICAAPANNWVDHGFWQISPTLKFDYFSCNDFEFDLSVGYFIKPGRYFRREFPLYPREAGVMNYVPARTGHNLHAVKTAASTHDRVPMQDMYFSKHQQEKRFWRFRASEPRDIIEGAEFRAPLRKFPLDRFLVKDGCLAAPFREEGFPPSVPNRPFRSKALVYEDGRLLDWIVSDPSIVRERPASFAHFGAFIYLSTSDGSDPRENGRRYEVAFPQPFEGLQPYQEDPNYSRT